MLHLGKEKSAKLWSISYGTEMRRCNFKPSEQCLAMTSKWAIWLPMFEPQMLHQMQATELHPNILLLHPEMKSKMVTCPDAGSKGLSSPSSNNHLII